jgi:sugar lactone lactonase YvrE
MLKGEIELLVPVEAKVTESPVWDARRKMLHFVDIYGCRIHSLDWATRATTSINTTEPVGCVGLAGEDHFIAGLKSGVALINRRTAKEQLLARIDEGAENRLNDGRCDPTGEFFWVGSMVERLDRAGGTLYRVSAQGQASALAGELICSNGLAWSPDGRLMYHSDSRQQTVWVYDYDRGNISNKRVFCRTRDGEGRPDGGAVDSEGCYWSARFDGWRIVRHAPDGRELFTLTTPVRNPTMCAFAGDDLRTLVFTSAQGAPDPESSEPHAGSVFAVEVDVQGLPEPTFKN